jgi:hypothetical protein
VGRGAGARPGQARLAALLHHAAPPHTTSAAPPACNHCPLHAYQPPPLTRSTTLQAPDAYDPVAKGLSFAFDYIDPVHPDCFQIIKRLYGGGDPHDVPNSGPAPVLVRYGELKGVTPVWERITADIENDAEAVKVLGGWHGWACEELCCC